MGQERGEVSSHALRHSPIVAGKGRPHLARNTSKLSVGRASVGAGYIGLWSWPVMSGNSAESPLPCPCRSLGCPVASRSTPIAALQGWSPTCPSRQSNIRVSAAVFTGSERP